MRIKKVHVDPTPGPDRSLYKPTRMLLCSGGGASNYPNGSRMNSGLRRKNLVRTGRTPPSVRPRLDAACAEIERCGKASRQPSCIGTRHRLRLGSNLEAMDELTGKRGLPIPCTCGEDERANQTFHAGLKLLLRFHSSRAALHVPPLPESLFLGASLPRAAAIPAAPLPAAYVFFLSGQGPPRPRLALYGSACATMSNHLKYQTYKQLKYNPVQHGELTDADYAGNGSGSWAGAPLRCRLRRRAELQLPARLLLQQVRLLRQD
jgi:hypothetical protein